MREWNPLFVLYARASGRTPEEQQSRNRATHPGAAAVPFMLWNSHQLREWRAVERAAGRPVNPVRSANYERWLAERVDNTADRTLFAGGAA